MKRDQADAQPGLYAPRTTPGSVQVIQNLFQHATSQTPWGSSHTTTFIPFFFFFFLIVRETLGIALLMMITIRK